MTDADADFDLSRFEQAQAAKQGGFADALRELRAGRKTSHWIWYVFPQLAGLGRSPQAVRYGLDGIAEATAYARHPVLGQRLTLAAEAAREHVAPAAAGRRPLSLEQLLGSSIDAQKLVSCMTLFEGVARALPETAALGEHATAILEAAVETQTAAERIERCAFTTAALRAA